MRIPIRTSKWAKWSRRLASLSVPLAVVPVIMHRERMVDDSTFHLLFALAMLVAAAAIVTALVAFARLWVSGNRGWGLSVQALFLGLLVLSPLAYAGVMVVRYPAVNDVTTAELGTPPLLFARNAAATALAAPQTATFFPEAVTRNYALDAELVFETAAALVAERGWDMRWRRGPSGSSREGHINAIAMTLLGWRDEIAIAIRADVTGTTLDMRSASMIGQHDLGSNGRRIAAFLSDLDAALAEANG